MKILLACSAALLLCACHSTPQHNDFSLNWPGQSASLTILDDEGKPGAAFGGRLIMIPGYMISGSRILLHPGNHRVGAVCPTPPGAMEILDVVPSLAHEFKAGRNYEMRCHMGYPQVRHAGPR